LKKVVAEKHYRLAAGEPDVAGEGDPIAEGVEELISRFSDSEETADYLTDRSPAVVVSHNPQTMPSGGNKIPQPTSREQTNSSP